MKNNISSAQIRPPVNDNEVVSYAETIENFITHAYAYAGPKKEGAHGKKFGEPYEVSSDISKNGAITIGIFSLAQGQYHNDLSPIKEVSLTPEEAQSPEIVQAKLAELQLELTDEAKNDYGVEENELPLAIQSMTAISTQIVKTTPSNQPANDDFSLAG